MSAAPRSKASRAHHHQPVVGRCDATPLGQRTAPARSLPGIRLPASSGHDPGCRARSAARKPAREACSPNAHDGLAVIAAVRASSHDRGEKATTRCMQATTRCMKEGDRVWRLRRRPEETTAYRSHGSDRRSVPVREHACPHATMHERCGRYETGVRERVCVCIRTVGLVLVRVQHYSCTCVSLVVVLP